MIFFTPTKDLKIKRKFQLYINKQQVLFIKKTILAKKKLLKLYFLHTYLFFHRLYKKSCSTLDLEIELYLPQPPLAAQGSFAKSATPLIFEPPPPGRLPLPPPPPPPPPDPTSPAVPNLLAAFPLRR